MYNIANVCTVVFGLCLNVLKNSAAIVVLPTMVFNLFLHMRYVCENCVTKKPSDCFTSWLPAPQRWEFSEHMISTLKKFHISSNPLKVSCHRTIWWDACRIGPAAFVTLSVQIAKKKRQLSCLHMCKMCYISYLCSLPWQQHCDIPSVTTELPKL